MAFGQDRARIDGYHVLEIPPDTDPVQAAEDAAILLEYAAMHTGRWSQKSLAALGHAQRFATRAVEAMD